MSMLSSSPGDDMAPPGVTRPGASGSWTSGSMGLTPTMDSLDRTAVARLGLTEDMSISDALPPGV
jgi:hypothetical protein